MDVILHVGAHRTATTSFQYYLRENSGFLRANGIGFWGPLRTRGELLRGVMPEVGPHSPEDQLRRARGRIALQLHGAQARGRHTVIVSDENMIGSSRRNLRVGQLYTDLGHRMARFAGAFGQSIARVVISIRNPETYWGSVLAYALARGGVPAIRPGLDRLAQSQRSWRDVITDLAHAVPDCEILVLPHETFSGRADEVFACITGVTGTPSAQADAWRNASPRLPELRQINQECGSDASFLPDGDGRWEPFDKEQALAMREAYEDDLFWLRGGADGIATLIEETGLAKTGQTPRAGRLDRGHPNGIEERRLA